MKNILLLFPEKNDNLEDRISNKSHGEVFVREILMTIERISCEKEVSIFFESENYKNFIDDYKTLQALLNVRIGLYNLESILLQYIQNNEIRLIANNNNYEKFRSNEFKKVDEYFNSLNKNRILNKADFRHCEDKPQYITSKSPLIGGSSSFNYVESLLSSALGNGKVKIGPLINFDNSNGNFLVRFEDENYNNQFHGFHLVKKIAGKYVEDAVELNSMKKSSHKLSKPLKVIEYRRSYKSFLNLS